MKLLIVLALAAVAYARTVEPVQLVDTVQDFEPVQVVDSVIEPLSAVGYIEKYAIPLAEKIRKAEEEMSQNRIVGGIQSNLGEFPYQAGLLAEYAGISGTGVCGGSLVSSNRVITAAHCWFDGRYQAFRMTVVLGSVLLFSGGTRLQSTNVVMHPNWRPTLIRNDVAVIYLPVSVAFSDTISPIALPSGAELNQHFAGASGVASGFGITSDGGSIPSTQSLSHVNLDVITNAMCSLAFPVNLHASNVCTSGRGGTSTCSGDSGGPLVITSNNRRVMIGITSFGSGMGCQVGFPAVFARVTSFMSFFNQHIDV